MIELLWTDRGGRECSVRVEQIRLWQVRKGEGSREHPEGTVIEGYRDRMGVIQLDANDRIGSVIIREVQ